MDDRYSPWTLFQAQAPAGLLAALCGQILLAYQHSYHYCDENFAREEAHDLYPKERRAMVERNIRHVVSRFPGVTAESVRNRTGGAFHVRVVFGQVVLTESKVESPRQLVRGARFREQYARSRQLSFLEEELERQPGEEALYGLLLHGPDKKRRHLPAFMRLAFPDAECKQYLDNVDLLAQYPDVEALLRPTSETIAVPRPRLRRRRAEENEG